MGEKEIRQKLRELAIEGAKNSHSPYSQARIGSAVLTTDGYYFNGGNIENSSFGGTVCAERVTIWKAVSEGHKRLAKIYVYSNAGWPPCGLCRQVMSEFAGPDLEIIVGDKDGKETVYTFAEIFPLAFTPEHLENR